jgi:hypothetical protein
VRFARKRPAGPPGEANFTAMRRMFLVGTARGGTTLLQSMLAAHPAVYSPPETHFWDYSLPKQPWLRRWRPVTPAHAARVRQFLAELPPPGPSAEGRDPDALADRLAARLPATPLRDPVAWTRGLLAVLDGLAEAAGRGAWLEKTPLHLWYTDLFRAADPEVRVLHLLRDPVEQVASLVDAGTRHAGAFRQGSVASAWKRWTREYARQRRLLGRPGHAFCTYDDLVERPEAALRHLLAFAGLPWDPAVLDFRGGAAEVIAAGEAWKDRNTGVLARSGKAELVLSPADRAWIRRRAVRYPLDPFRVPETP